MHEDDEHLFAAGCRNHEIARRLGMSEKTVRNHVSQVLVKLQVPDRTMMSSHTALPVKTSCGPRSTMLGSGGLGLVVRRTARACGRWVLRWFVRHDQEVRVRVEVR